MRRVENVGLSERGDYIVGNDIAQPVEVIDGGADVPVHVLRGDQAGQKRTALLIGEKQHVMEAHDPRLVNCR